MYPAPRAKDNTKRGCSREDGGRLYLFQIDAQGDVAFTDPHHFHFCTRCPPKISPVVKVKAKSIGREPWVRSYVRCLMPIFV